MALRNKCGRATLLGASFETWSIVESGIVLYLHCCLLGLIVWESGMQTPLKDAYAAAKAISKLEGVVEHGLFLDMAQVVIIAGANGIEVKTK